MLDSLKDLKKCELCGGDLLLNTISTFSNYRSEIVTLIDDVNSKVDEIIGRYLVYSCTNCGFEYKFTYRTVEMLLRKRLTQKALVSIISSNFKPSYVLGCKFYIYCGKCSGLDGSGSCPKEMYDMCDVKRFPVYEL